MKKIFLTGTLALAASLGGLTVSCGDFLDITPLNAVVVQNYWEKKSEVESVITSCYYHMQDAGFAQRVIAWGEVRGDNLFIYLPEELDHHNAKIITEQSDWYIISNQIKNIVFNFSNTNFMDSSGVGVIMGRYKLIKPRGGNVTVTNINKAIDRILTISGLYKIVSKTETSSLAQL